MLWAPLATIDLTTLLVALMGAGGLSGVVALLKFKPERDVVVVSAAQGAVVVQSGVINALQAELVRARADLAEERTRRLAAEARIVELEARLK